MDWQQKPEHSKARRIMRGAGQLAVLVTASLVMGGAYGAIKDRVFEYAVESTVEDIEDRNDLSEAVAKELEDTHKPMVEEISQYFDGEKTTKDSNESGIADIMNERHFARLAKKSPSGTLYEIWIEHWDDVGGNGRVDAANEDTRTYTIMSSSPEGNEQYVIISTPDENRDILTDKPSNEWSSKAGTKEWVAGKAISARFDTAELDDTSEKVAQATKNMDLAKDLLETFENLPENS
jgi:hypothetical protein